MLNDIKSYIGKEEFVKKMQGRTMDFNVIE